MRKKVMSGVIFILLGFVSTAFAASDDLAQIITGFCTKLQLVVVAGGVGALLFGAWQLMHEGDPRQVKNAVKGIIIAILAFVLIEWLKKSLGQTGV